MKYKGEKLTGKNSDVLVLVKGDKKVVFKAETLMTYAEFDAVCPEPKPPTVIKKGGIVCSR